MTIFQKIAASSFAAVRATLRRRLLNLTIHEAIVCDQNLDVEGRERALSDARQLFHEMFGLPTDSFGRAQVDRLLADARVKLLRKLGEKSSPKRRMGSSTRRPTKNPPQCLFPSRFPPNGKEFAIC